MGAQHPTSQQSSVKMKIIMKLLVKGDEPAPDRQFLLSSLLFYENSEGCILHIGYYEALHILRKWFLLMCVGSWWFRNRHKMAYHVYGKCDFIHDRDYLGPCYIGCMHLWKPKTQLTHMNNTNVLKIHFYLGTVSRKDVFMSLQPFGGKLKVQVCDSGSDTHTHTRRGERRGGKEGEIGKEGGIEMVCSPVCTMWI